MAWGTEDENGQMRYDLHPGQAAVWNSQARYRAAIAGTGGGKTAMGPLFCLQEIQKAIATRDVESRPIIGMVLAPTHQIMARATSEEFQRVFKDSDLCGRYVESKNMYVLPRNLGVVWLLSADRPEGIEGGQVDFCWMDEAGQMKYKTWEAVQGRVGLRYSRVLITTTPYSVNWLKKKFCVLADAGNKDYFYHQWSSITNPAYPKASYDAAKISLSAARFAMRYHGHFTVAMGLVYPEFEQCIKSFTAGDVKKGRLVGGMDWGFSPDPFAAICALRTGPIIPGAKDHLWFFYTRYIVGCTSAENAAALRCLQGCRWYVDSAGGEELKVFTQAGFSVAKNKVLSRIVGIDAVTKRIRLGTMTIHPDLMDIREEAEEYQFPVKDDAVVSGEPIGTHHLLDGIRYLISNLDRFENAKDQDWQYQQEQESQHEYSTRSELN